MQAPCPCGSEQVNSECCLPLIENRSASTAEALMQSRYTAYVTGNAAYLLDSWYPDTRPSNLEPGDNQKWLGLKIRRVVQGGPGDSNGVVEFVAR